MSRTNPRRPASSRTTTPRPRRLAGQRPGAEDDATTETAETTETDTSVEGSGPAKDTKQGKPVKPSKPRKPSEPTDVGEDDDREPWWRAGVDNPRATRVLAIALGVLAVLLLLQGAWWLRHELRDDPAANVPEGEIAVPDDRPVIMSRVAWQEGADAAGKAAVNLVGRSFENYDADVDEALAVLTPSFEEEYRQVTDDVKAEFVQNRIVVEARVVGQSVMRANETELQALVFLNRYTTKGPKDQPQTTYEPYRAVLTMVHTDEGWLVDDIQTK
jgi:Mce-associated membrane protein